MALGTMELLPENSFILDGNFLSHASVTRSEWIRAFNFRFVINRESKRVEWFAGGVYYDGMKCFF